VIQVSINPFTTMKKVILFLALLFVTASASAQTTTIAGLSPTQVKTVLLIGNVENTALSTWLGTTNITTLGTVTAGTWNAGVIGVTYGGLGAATLASNGMLFGNGTGAVQALAVNSTATNKFLTQSSSAAPAWAVLLAADIPSLDASKITTGSLVEANGGTHQTTYATGDILYASGTNTLGKLAAGSTNQVLTIVGGVPSWQAPGALITTTITADQVAANNNAYINNKITTQLVLTLPTTAAVGAFIEVNGKNSPGFRIAQNISQMIHVGGTTTTTGTGGYLNSNEQWDVICVTCIVANLEWSVTYSQGSITSN
jgi:hypothetical protein